MDCSFKRINLLDSMRGIVNEKLSQMQVLCGYFAVDINKLFFQTELISGYFSG